MRTIARYTSLLATTPLILVALAACGDSMPAEPTAGVETALTSHATPMTTGVLHLTQFVPGVDGFQFTNDFVNIFGPLETSGLCGGMSYAALDYFNAKMTIPQQSYRPEEGTPFQSYIYGRQETSIESNIGTWGSWGINPGGIDNTAILANTFSTQVALVVASINQGKPIPLGLDGTNGSGSHQVLAVGYSADSNQNDIQIYLYNPNYPGQMVTLVFNTTNQVFTIAEYPLHDQWTGFFADTNYTAQTPPVVASPSYANDGLIHQLFLEVETGSDALEGGSNAELDIGLTNGTKVSLTNLNLGQKWVPYYKETVAYVLPTPLDPQTIASLTLNKIGGNDSWDVMSAVVEAVGSSTWVLATGCTQALGCTAESQPLAIVQRPPTIISLQPPAAVPGATIAITGSGFRTDGTTSVMFGATPGATTCTSSTACTAVVPTGSGTVNVNVTVPVLKYSSSLPHPPAPLQAFSAGAGIFTFPLPAPSCAPTATCSVQYEGMGVGGTKTFATVTVTDTCQTNPGSLEELVGGSWVVLSPFNADLNDLPQLNGVYTLEGPVGSVQSVRSCSDNVAGSLCDSAVSVTVPSCASDSGSSSTVCGNTKCGAGHYLDTTKCACVADFCACGGVYPKCKVCQ